jgi:hypothetical protein
VQVVDASSLYLLYTFADGGGDLPRVGDYGLAVDLTTSAGDIPCLETILSVSPRFSRS